ncbi:MAG: choice-of-anchor J domain-containing protein, partial [Hymenobacteraceae bacterium]|nr:choice-of-anchor J domain-containing protein [Hymenobacteraceae bacterium]MDX5513078.1 choice-of-anchor J domain-containing protein [Hymenobacteraceae bacterium]
MTTYGNYTFDATVSLTGDVNSANDTAATLNVTNITPATLPVTVDFTGYTGANLATVFPNWREGDGDTTPDGTSSSWTDDDFANNSSSINGAAARTNFDGTTDTEWIVGPKITPTAGTKLRFDLALTESGNSNAATLGSDDQFQVMVSTNCGNSYTAIRTYTSATPISNTGQTELVDLSAYAGQDIIVAFFANEGTVNDPEDVDLFIDNIFIGTPPSLDLATTALVSPVSGGCFGNAEPVVVTIENAATTAVDFATDPVTVTVVVGGAATQTFTVTVNTGTLAPGATRNVTLGNLNMSATGNYTFDATVSASGDGNAANNALPTVTINNTIISTFPHTEDFESFSTATNATGYANGWSATPSGTTSSYRWNIDTGTTPSSGTGPNADHTLGTSSGKYVFTEASSGSAGDSAILESPCIDLSSLTAPGMEFWYHMFGGDMGDLHVDVWNGTQWNRSVLVISGEQQTSTSAPWQKAKVNLMAYTGSTIKVRFRGINGVGFESDMAVDDVKFYNIPPTDASLTAFVSPVTSGCYGAGEPVTVTIKNEGSTPLTSVPVTVAISGAATQTLNGTFTGTIAPGSSVNFTVGTLNMSAAGTYSFVGYPTVTGDADAANDTIRMTITSTTVSTFPYLEDFESFSTGTNATGYGNGWVATPSGTTSSFRWNIDTNGTPSSDTGPAVDHTLGTSSGKYVFTEASSGSTGDVAILESPCINLSSLTTPGVEFWYHMFGGDMGDLHVDIFNGTQWDSSVFVLSGQQQASDTEAWKKARINLATYTGSTIKVRFRGIRGADFEGDMAIDDVRFFDIPAADLELVKVLLPASGCGLTNQETISAIISNVGSASQSNFPVNFTINSSAPVSVSYTGTLAAGATDTLVLTTTADFSSVGNYAVTVYTALAGDANTANDTISNMTVTNVTTVSVFPYVEDFESGASGWSAGGANSTWALGTPAGPVIDTAASGTNAWVTNLTGNYNSNEASFVESPCFDMSSVNNPVVSLKIWWQTENSFDGALLQATTNNGATWQTIG